MLTLVIPSSMMFFIIIAPISKVVHSSCIDRRLGSYPDGVRTFSNIKFFLPSGRVSGHQGCEQTISAYYRGMMIFL